MANAKVAVLYAISRGITKAGVGAEMVNLEQVTTDEAQEVLKSSQGFVIGEHLQFMPPAANDFECCSQTG
jgi:flavorubredoxin